MLEKPKQNTFTWTALFKATWFLWGLGEARKKYIAKLIILFFILLYSVVPALVVGEIVNFFTRYQKGDSLAPFYLYSGFLGVSYIVVAHIRLQIKKKLSMLKNSTVYHIRVKGFSMLASQSLLQTKHGTTGEKTQRIQNGTDSFNAFFSLLSNEILTAAASFIGMFSVFAVVSPVFSMFFLIYLCVFLGIINFFHRRLDQLSVDKNKALERASGIYVEGLSNLLTLKASGSEQAFQKRILEKEAVSREFGNKIIRTGNNQWKTFQTFNGLSVGIFLFMVGVGVARSALTVGDIVVFYSYMERLRSVADDIMKIYNELIGAKAGVGRLMDVFKQDIGAKGSEAPFPESWKKIALKDGTFFYGSEKESKRIGIEKLTMEIKAGQQIGIVGKTGSGKSTVAKVLLGLYPLQSGTYAIGGVDFYQLRQEEIRRHVSMVLQETEMFSLSLLENITLMRNIDPDLLKKAIEISQLEEVVAKLPRGMGTLIGEKGYRLSGGERQRVGIARAICQESEILILDEATSSLDARTESAIYDAMEKEFPNKTIIIIAHRIRTLRNTDAVYVFDKGNVVEKGKFSTLQSNPDSFFNKIYGKEKENGWFLEDAS